MKCPIRMSFFMFMLFVFISFGCISIHKSVAKASLAKEPSIKEPVTKVYATNEPKTKQPITKKTVTEEYVVKAQRVAADFELQDIYQDIYTLSSYRDKEFVLLFFWTTRCPFCQKELRILNQRYAGLAEDGIEVLAINVGDLPSNVERFVRGYYLAYRVLLDKDAAVARAYGLLGVPTYVIVDKEGYIIFEDNYFPQEKYKDLISKEKISK